MCFGWEAPWRSLVPEAEFKERVLLSGDQCVIDEKIFLLRGHIEIPILDAPEQAAFSVWTSLSQTSFMHAFTRWEAPDRANDPPYFGWMCSEIAVYPSTLHLKLSVQSRELGMVPLFTVEPTEHPLARDQHGGITLARWHALARALMA
jgi:hypothetical protein